MGSRLCWNLESLRDCNCQRYCVERYNQERRTWSHKIESADDYADGEPLEVRGTTQIESTVARFAVTPI
eukprot:1153405-Amphidinium_carterae.2